MAISTVTYDINQFRVAIKAETTVGTANVATMQLVNIDSNVNITRNPYQHNGYRAGVGRTKKKPDHFVQEYGQVKSFQLTGIADKASFPMLMENCVGVTEASQTIDIAYNYTGADFAVGLAAVSDNIHTLTVALVSPIAANSVVIAGCIVDEITYTDDIEDGGRRHFTATLMTRNNILDGQATPGSMVAYPATYYSWFDLTAQKAIGGSDVVLGKVDLRVKSNVRFMGLGTNGVGELIDRGIPGIEVTAAVSVKFDANTKDLLTDYEDATDIIVNIADNAAIASAAMGFVGNFARLTTDVNNTETEDGAFIDLEFEFFASTTGNVIQIAV
jgi:hypothetical protein